MIFIRDTVVLMLVFMAGYLAVFEIDQKLKLKLKLKNMEIKEVNCENEILRYRLKLHQNHVYRMQLIMGVKNPDSIITYKEKIDNPITF